MRPRQLLPILFVYAFLASPTGSAIQDQDADYAISPVPYRQVDITDGFWTHKIEANRTVSIQHVFARSEARGGNAPAQLVEAAAYMLAQRPDPALEKHVDEQIDRFVAAIDAR